MELTDTEVRVLGALVEKEMATPDNYPLSLNALTTACNQKTSRDPVVEYDEQTVLDAIESLKHAAAHDAGPTPELRARLQGAERDLAEAVNLSQRCADEQVRAVRKTLL